MPANAATTDVPPPQLPADTALFLDFDGVFSEIVDDPETAHAAPGALDAVTGLTRRFGGALAIVTGRPITFVDRVLAPLTPAVAGLHGLEMRGSDGVLHPPEASAAIEAFRTRVLAARGDDGPEVEDKGASLALHYRTRPELKARAEALVAEAMEGLDGLDAVHGKMVIEVRPSTSDKGRAVERFLATPPFAGRIPVFVGDDVTDEDGFRMAARLGGFGIKVGAGETAARYRLADVTSVVGWLQGSAI